MIRESNDQRPIEVHSVEELERMTGLTVPATQAHTAGTTLSQPQLHPTETTEPQTNPRNTMPPMPSLLSMPTPQPKYQSYYTTIHPYLLGTYPLLYTTCHNCCLLLHYTWPHMPITCHHSLHLATLTLVQPKYLKQRNKMLTTLSYHNSLITLIIYPFILYLTLNS